MHNKTCFQPNEVYRLLTRVAGLGQQMAYTDTINAPLTKYNSLRLTDLLVWITKSLFKCIRAYLAQLVF